MKNTAELVLISATVLCFAAAGCFVGLDNGAATDSGAKDDGGGNGDGGTNDACASVYCPDGYGKAEPGSCEKPPCEGLDFCACSHRDDCAVQARDCLCPCDSCPGEPPCDCDCGGGEYLGCAGDS